MDGPLVLKFGGSLLRGDEDLERVGAWVAAEEARSPGRGATVVVVSAFGTTTDRLLARAAELHPDQEDRVAALAATGEEGAAAMVDVALVAAGRVPALLGPADLGLVTEGPLLDADPVELERDALACAMARTGLVVVPGFVGRHRDGTPSLLGRGGSDLTALFLAHRLGARACVLLKDVAGIHDGDPKAGAAELLAEVPLGDLARHAGQVLQPKAAAYAAAVGRAFTLGRPDEPDRRTRVG